MTYTVKLLEGDRSSIESAVENYLNGLSSPTIDRIDIAHFTADRIWVLIITH